jgi:hypothetical protein
MNAQQVGLDRRFAPAHYLRRYENKRDLMKLFLTVLISFFTLGCMPNKALLISQAEQGAPEDYCSDPSYRTCTLSGTYRQCLSEVRSYVSPCSRKSFPQNKANYSKSEFMTYHRNFSYCLLGMHISDKAEEGKLEANPMCEERGFYSIHEKKK